MFLQENVILAFLPDIARHLIQDILNVLVGHLVLSEAGGRKKNSTFKLRTRGQVQDEPAGAIPTHWGRCGRRRSLRLNCKEGTVVPCIKERAGESTDEEQKPGIIQEIASGVFVCIILARSFSHHIVPNTESRNAAIHVKLKSLQTHLSRWWRRTNSTFFIALRRP